MCSINIQFIINSYYSYVFSHYHDWGKLLENSKNKNKDLLKAYTIVNNCRFNYYLILLMSLLLLSPNGYFPTRSTIKLLPWNVSIKWHVIVQFNRFFQRLRILFHNIYYYYFSHSERASIVKFERSTLLFVPLVIYYFGLLIRAEESSRKQTYTHRTYLLK